ncbi:MAG: ATP synthase F1 subunit gamma [Candidatus Nomurabacteria bacterium]|jgi:F-type H+-transporting ATPase subunit gamma|nr:ATP synthase F1 subunit gamma [Candidatus Nomurabacteria bacterium]
MASVSKLKSRIRSVSSTKQITGAMELVSASKMRRAVKQTMDSEPFHDHASLILMNLANQEAHDKYGFFEHRQLKTRLILVISSDTGLAGAYNSNVAKKLIAELERDRERGVQTLVLTLGRKVSSFVSRLEHVEVIGTYNNSDINSTIHREAIYTTIFEKYRQKEIDAADIIYTKFNSAVNQEVRTWHLLPAGHIPGVEIPISIQNAKFEPSRGQVLDAVVEWLLNVQVAQAISDSAAAEFSQRMLAMKNATDNAEELVEDLTLAMNKARQSAITNELIDINAGAMAVS